MILWIEITLIIGNFRSLFARSFSDIIKIARNLRVFASQGANLIREGSEYFQNHKYFLWAMDTIQFASISSMQF